MQWLIRNGTHTVGAYAVFLLGKDQICILDTKKKQIALIDRRFGPVLAKPGAEKTPEAIEAQTTNSPLEDTFFP